jgi:hypothetical protein
MLIHHSISIGDRSSSLHILLAQPSAGRPLGGTAAEALRAVHLPCLSRGDRPIGCLPPARIARHKQIDGEGGARCSQLPNPAGFLGVHGLAFGALKRLAELFEVLDGAIHTRPSHRMRAVPLPLSGAAAARSQERATANSRPPPNALSDPSPLRQCLLGRRRFLLGRR